MPPKCSCILGKTGGILKNFNCYGCYIKLNQNVAGVRCVCVPGTTDLTPKASLENDCCWSLGLLLNRTQSNWLSFMSSNSSYFFLLYPWSELPVHVVQNPIFIFPLYSIGNFNNSPDVQRVEPVYLSDYCSWIRETLVSTWDIQRLLWEWYLTPPSLGISI